MSLAVMVGVFGLVGVHRTEGRADAATDTRAFMQAQALDWPAPPGLQSVVDLPVPPRVLMTREAAEPTTTTTVPPETTTTVPPETTTTTVPSAPPPTTAPPPPAPKPPAPKPPAPVVATSGPVAQAQVEAIADSTGWNWRAAGVRFKMSYYPTDCCHWGVYEAATSIIWVGPTAFGDPNRLRYVVLHELAHGWQYRQNRFAQFISDYATWGFNTIGPALEAGADCVAALWGAGRGHYWSCPPAALALAQRRLGGDWR
ncbi:MAG TPA: hypothetical protein VG034_29800 [Acidimicrobiia bacterium]|nr:hypothetical protein [Acidimicrobiia bacterium]